jgi:hypothetical protein
MTCIDKAEFRENAVEAEQPSLVLHLQLSRGIPAEQRQDQPPDRVGDNRVAIRRRMDAVPLVQIGIARHSLE